MYMSIWSQIFSAGTGQDMGRKKVLCVCLERKFYTLFYWVVCRLYTKFRQLTGIKATFKRFPHYIWHQPLQEKKIFLLWISIMRVLPLFIYLNCIRITKKEWTTKPLSSLWASLSCSPHRTGWPSFNTSPSSHMASLLLQTLSCVQYPRGFRPEEW